MARGLALLVLLGWAAAQTLVGTIGAAASALALDPSVRLPQGSYRVEGGLTPALAQRLGDAARWQNYEIYVLKGPVAGVGEAALTRLKASFLAAGYRLVEEAKTRAGKETRVRFVFQSPEGRPVLLFAVRAPRTFVYVVAERRP